MNRRIVVLMALSFVFLLRTQVFASPLKEELQKLKQAGIPTTLKEIAPPIIPDSENAAFIYQKVFDLMEKNKEDIDILKPMFYTQYQEKGRSFSRYSDIPEWSKWSEEQKKNLPLLIEKNKEIFQFLEKAAAMPKCRFPIDYYRGPAMICLHLSKLRNCASLLAIKATIESEKESNEKAVNTLIVGFGISRALSIEPLLNSQMVRISIDRTLIRKANDLVTNGTVSVDIYKRLVNTFEHERNAAIISLGFLEIYPSIKWHFDYFKKYPEKELQLMSGTEYSAQEKEKQEEFIQKYLPVIKEDEIYAINETFKLINLTKKPYWEVKDELQGMEKAMGDLKGEEHILSLLFLPVYGGTYVNEANLDALLGAAELGLANRIYRQKHGKFADSFSQLTPDILPSLPLDPFTGKNYIYRLKDKGFIIYSVADNLKDDGGIPQFSEKGKQGDFDIVWEDNGGPDIKGCLSTEKSLQMNTVREINEYLQSDTAKVIMEKMRQCTVLIQTTKKTLLPNPSGVAREVMMMSGGSGIIIGPEGYILTCRGAIANNPQDMTVTLSGGRIIKGAKVLEADPVRDIALLKIDSPVPLPYVQLGDSDKTNIGESIIACGYSGPDKVFTITVGIVNKIMPPGFLGASSGLPDVEIIASDAQIRQGSMGGAFVNMKGEVIGLILVVVEKGPLSPSSLAISINYAKPMVSSLAK